MKKYLLHIQGAHCSACKMLVEEALLEHEGILGAKVNLKNETVEIEGDFSKTPEEMIRILNPLLEANHYNLSIEKNELPKNLDSLLIALPIGLGVLAIFFFLQKSGLVNFGFEGTFTLWTPLFIGMVASVSSCLAVVGGLILSLSATISKETSSVKPLALFHMGRILGFLVLGGVLGMLGSVISINYTATSILGIIASMVMILLGINLLDVFPLTKSLQVALPKSLFARLSFLGKGAFAPFLIGALTFFLPCGFTQAMQVQALSSGSWLQGGLIMVMFAMGTLPMLVLLSFSSFRFSQTKYAKVFFQSTGVLVLGLGIFALLAGLAALGIIPPLFNI